MPPDRRYFVRLQKLSISFFSTKPVIKLVEVLYLMVLENLKYSYFEKKTVQEPQTFIINFIHALASRTWIWKSQIKFGHPISRTSEL